MAGITNEPSAKPIAGKDKSKDNGKQVNGEK
jgi:hypothetical protein